MMIKRTSILLLLFFVHCMVGHAQRRYPDTTGLRILFAGSLPNRVTKANFLRSPVLTTNLDGWKVVRYKISAHYKGGDYWGPFDVAGERLPASMDKRFNPFTWQAIFISDIVVACEGVSLPVMNGQTLGWFVRD